VSQPLPSRGILAIISPHSRSGRPAICYFRSRSGLGVSCEVSRQWLSRVGGSLRQAVIFRSGKRAKLSTPACSVTCYKYTAWDTRSSPSIYKGAVAGQRRLLRLRSLRKERSGRAAQDASRGGCPSAPGRAAQDASRGGWPSAPGRAANCSGVLQEYPLGTPVVPLFVP
jgi:hypothetical protein